MEAFESSSGVVTHAGPRDSYPRYTRVARVEIDCRMPDYVVDGGHLLPKGKSVVTVPGRAVDAILALAWDDEEEARIKRATDQRDKLVEAELRAEFHPEMSVPAFRDEIARVRSLHEDARDERENDLIKAIRESHTTTRHSIESCFFEEHHRGINPFRSVKVLDRDLPLPEEESKLMHDKAQLGALVEMLTKAAGGSGGNDARMSQLENEIAELKSLLEMATAPKKK